MTFTCKPNTDSSRSIPCLVRHKIESSPAKPEDKDTIATVSPLNNFLGFIIKSPPRILIYIN